MVWALAPVGLGLETPPASADSPTDKVQPRDGTRAPPPEAQLSHTRDHLHPQRQDSLQTRWVPGRTCRGPPAHRPRRARGCSPGVRLGGQRRWTLWRNGRSLPPPSLGFPVQSGGTRRAHPPAGPASPTRIALSCSVTRLCFLRPNRLPMAAGPAVPRRPTRSDPCPAPHGYRSSGPTHPATAAARGARRRRTRNAAVCGQKPRPEKGLDLQWAGLRGPGLRGSGAFQGPTRAVFKTRCSISHYRGNPAGVTAWTASRKVRDLVHVTAPLDSDAQNVAFSDVTTLISSVH